jgi:hypothetical protein
MLSTLKTRETFIQPLNSKGDPSINFNKFVTQQEAYASSTRTDLGREGMRPFYLHYNDQQLQERHPGAIRLAPPVEPIEPDVNDPNYANLIKAYDRALARFNSYNAGVIDIIAGWLDFIPNMDKSALEALDPTNGLASVSANGVYCYLERKFGKLTESAKNSLISVMTKDLSLTMSLEENLSDMRIANAALIANNIGFSEYQMFNFAYDKLRKNPRTADIAEDYKKRDGYVPTQANFTDFFTYVVNQYDVRAPPASTAAFAFCVDSDFSPSFSTPVRGSAPVEEPPVAAAAISPGKTVTISQEEFDRLQAIVSSAGTPNKNSSNPRSVAPGYCILCGFTNHGPGHIGQDGKPRYCRKMADADGNPLPNTRYTKPQILCKKSEGGPVDGISRSQKVNPRFKKP